MELFQKAAALDEVYALFRLGEFCRDAKYGFKQDGHIAAEIFHDGKGGVAPDGLKAIELYKRLDEIESLDGIKSCKALFRIAEIYTEGCGSLLPNRQKALEFYRQSAESGYSFAKERLSELTGSDE